jgi:uncharacterized protein YdiU (UPF0061 family)
MLVGFIHGVMNTDNMTISGETIDYGPCAFMDAFDPATVFSSIDHGGRYAYGNQPPIAQWNLARLAETLLPLFSVETDTAVAAADAMLQSFPDRYFGYWRRGMRAKLGLALGERQHARLEHSAEVVGVGDEEVFVAVLEQGVEHVRPDQRRVEVAVAGRRPFELGVGRPLQRV